MESFVGEKRDLEANYRGLHTVLPLGEEMKKNGLPMQQPRLLLRVGDLARRYPKNARFRV